MGLRSPAARTNQLCHADDNCQRGGQCSGWRWMPARKETWLTAELLAARAIAYFDEADHLATRWRTFDAAPTVTSREVRHTFGMQEGQGWQAESSAPAPAAKPNGCPNGVRYPSGPTLTALGRQGRPQFKMPRRSSICSRVSVCDL
jgi:hypothetical protein